MDKKNILEKLHIAELNAMQQAALEASRRDKDLILLSPTGSGKTLAYLLPLLDFLKEGVEGVQAIVLVPSRELALQIEQVFKQMNTGFGVMSCYGGHPTMEEHRTMNGIRPALIIGTPGRMNDHLKKQNFNAETVRLLVIDEFDKCLEFGFQAEMSEVISLLPSLERRFLFSATDSEYIPRFVGTDCQLKLDFLNHEKRTSDRLRLYKVMSPLKDKLETLYRLLCHIGNEATIVFCNHRESVDRVGGFLRKQRVCCEVFHGGMEQEERERALYKFRNGSCPVLVSTDLAARGLDIPEIRHVIHYHLPVSEEGFLHRNGRTARWEACGTAYVILYVEENVPDYLPDDMDECVLPATVAAPPCQDFVTLYVGKGKKDKINKVDIVGFLLRKGQLEKGDVGRIDVKEHYAFVAIRTDKYKRVLKLSQNEKIKGVKVLMELAK